MRVNHRRTNDWNPVDKDEELDRARGGGGKPSRSTRRKRRKKGGRGGF